jgi:rod shape-determining protein MreC
MEVTLKPGFRKKIDNLTFKNEQMNQKIEPRYILLFSTIILVALIFISYKFSDFFTPIRQTVNSSLVPMQKGITVVGNYFVEKSEYFQNIEALQKENDALKADYEELQAKYNTLLTDSYELENLRLLFQLSETYSQYETVGANIISTDTTGYNSVFTIDKGADDGIEENMNVIADNGLVGIVTSVGDNYAIVRTIIDDNSNVSATILKSSDSCMVSGNLKLLDEGYIEVSEIPLTSDVKNNYQVVTSSMSTKYLPDLLIGYISNVTVSSDGLSLEAYLTPVVDFTSLDTVLVITTLKESTEISE